VFCDVGSIHEPDSIRGAAHFVEHMCFKGTKRISEVKDIFSVYDDVGAIVNAYTDKRYTEYIIKVDDQFAEKCIHMMSDMILNSTFPKKEFVKEEKVVIEENLRTRDNPNANLNDMSESLLYQGSSFAFPVDMVQYHRTSFDYKKIVDFYHHFYRHENMVLSIVSQMPFHKIVDIIERSFFVKNIVNNKIIKDTAVSSERPFAIHPKYAIQYSTLHQTKPIYLFMKKPGTDTIHMNISFRTCNQTVNDKYVLDLLVNILSGSFGTRLPMLLREKNGLTYTSNAKTNYYEHAGDFTIYAQMDHTKLFHNSTKDSKGVLPLLIDMLSDLVRNGVSEIEFKRAKRNMQEKMKMNLENSAVLAEHNGRELLLYSDPANLVTYDHYFDRHIKPIVRSDILRVIRSYFKKDRMVFTIVSDNVPPQSSVEKEFENFVEHLEV